MKSNATTVDDYLAELPEQRRSAIEAVRDTINAHLPSGYQELIDYGMISWVIPLEDYPDTYNGKPLPIVSLASQKNHMAVYLMGLYPSSPEEQWFRDQYAARGMKLDMGKSCVRFKKVEELPLDVLGEVIAMIPPAKYVDLYESSRGEPG